MLALRVGACKRFFAAITTWRGYRSLQSDLSCGMNRNTWHTPSHAPTGMQTLDQRARLRVIVLSSLLCRPSSSSPGRSTQFDSCAIPISRTGASSRRLTVSRRRGLLALCVPPARLLVRPAHERAQLREKSSVSPIDGRVPVLTPLREIGARLRPCQSDRWAGPRFLRRSARSAPGCARVSPIDGQVPVLTPLREIGARLRPCQSDRRAGPRFLRRSARSAPGCARVSPIDGQVPVLTPLCEIGARLRPCQSDRRACPRSYPFSRGNRYAYVRNVTHLYPLERAPRTAIYCKPRCRPSTPVVPS